MASNTIPAPAATSTLVERYLHLTRSVLPALARDRQPAWPVRNDHCFQRIILDVVCDGVWYDHIARPAYKHLSSEQAQRAITLCEHVIPDTADLAELNRKSLIKQWCARLDSNQRPQD